VLWPHGAQGPFDWFSAAIGLAALVALFRFKTGVMPVIGACAVAGLAVTLLKPLV
jgi:chromate transporter